MDTCRNLPRALRALALAVAAAGVPGVGASHAQGASAAASQAPGQDDAIVITLAHGTPHERLTAQRLRALLAANDLSAWTFTHQVVIDETEIPHSHPVLTLHARHRHDDELLLSTYVHEQMHWFLATRPEETAAAEAALRLRYPRIPVGYPEGSSDDDGNYEHLLVVYLEYRADEALLGELKAREVMQFWADDHYKWLYAKVLSEPRAIGDVIHKYHLEPGQP
jgi:hypothetical protein